MGRPVEIAGREQAVATRILSGSIGGMADGAVEMNTVSGGLKQLHELHVQHKAVSEVLMRGPRQVEARKRNAAKKLDEIEQLRLQLTQTRKLGDEKALQLKVNEQRILDQQAKLNAASTNREFDIIR
ncbi:MAG: hypothetical protein KDA79_19065, partial [Planctomycetaceae bacterium]|nr:hypothetical protein [Planctomycetaceae bacterium]